MSFSAIQFYRLKCRQCGSKFTVTTNIGCAGCKFLGVECKHRTLCFKCYKNAINDGLFFSTFFAIMSILAYGIGVSIQ